MIKHETDAFRELHKCPRCKKEMPRQIALKSIKHCARCSRLNREEAARCKSWNIRDE